LKKQQTCKFHEHFQQRRQLEDSQQGFPMNGSFSVIIVCCVLEGIIALSNSINEVGHVW